VFTHFLAKTISSRVPEGMWGVHKTCGNSRGVGGYFVFKKMEILGRRERDLHEISSVMGVWILSGTTQLAIIRQPLL